MDALDPVVASALISGVVGGLVVAMYNQISTRIRERERSEESVSMKLLDLRVKPYAALMQALAVISNARMRVLDVDEQREVADGVSKALNDAIYGDVGILASTGTREVILCARSRCARFVAAKCAYEDMMESVWAIHQMLRADLNHQQDEVEREIDRVRSSNNKMAAKQEAIERIIRDMPHVRWASAGD